MLLGAEIGIASAVSATSATLTGEPSQTIQNSTGVGSAPFVERIRQMSGFPMIRQAAGLGGLGSMVGLGSYVSAPTRPIGLLGLVGGPQKAPRQYPCFEMYLDSKAEWRWRFKASNYKKIADSGEGYNRIEDARHGIALIQGNSNWPTYIGDAD